MSASKSPILVDTHCHLDFDAFDADRQQVIGRAREGGVGWMVVPGIEVESSRGVLKLAEAQRGIYAAVGVHPNSARTWQMNSLETLSSLSQHARVVAIGEIGLDYYRDCAPREQQRRVFEAQLNLAAEVGLPVIIHSREASEDMLAMLTAWQEQLQRAGCALAERPGVLHSFSGDWRVAEALIRLNFLLGISGPVTFRNAPALQEVAVKAPLERLLIETDAPFLSPHPYRGRRNEPAYVRKVAEKIAELRGVSLEEVAQTTTANAERLFVGRETVD